jgi:hypothetical protein
MANKALDAEPPIASLLKSMLIGGGPVNAVVRLSRHWFDTSTWKD